MLRRVPRWLPVVAVAVVGAACGGERPVPADGSSTAAATSAEASTATAAAAPVRVTGGGPAERAAVQQVLAGLGSSDVVAVEVTAPAPNAANVVGPGITVTVRAAAASDDGGADFRAHFVGAEVAAGYRDRAWTAKLTQPVGYAVRLQRPDGKVEAATGGEVAPVGAGDGFSVDKPVAVSSDRAAALERFVRDLAAGRGDRIERLTLLRPMTLAVLLDVQVHDAHAGLCKAAKAYTDAIYPQTPRAGVGPVSDALVSVHGGPGESGWGFYAAGRAGEFSGSGDDCVGEDAWIAARAVPVPPPSRAACERLLTALTEAAARAEQCRDADRHAWLTATIANTGPDEVGVRCTVDGLDDGGGAVWRDQVLRDPASIGNVPGGGPDLPGGATATITWQVAKPPAASYAIRCPIDRSSGG